MTQKFTKTKILFYLNKQLSTAMTQKFMKSNLYFK
jgi:hypothetical protein